MIKMNRKFRLLKDTVKSKASDIFDENLKLNGNNEIVYSYGVEVYTLQEILEHPDFFEEVFENEYTWEKCFDSSGFFIHENSAKIICVGKVYTEESTHNVFKHIYQAKSALAKAQLSHIIAVANKNSDGSVEVQNTNEGRIIAYDIDDKQIVFCGSYYKNFLWFKSEEIARKVYEQNKQLIHDYLEIEL